MTTMPRGTAAILVVGAVLLGGCTGSPDPDPTRSAAPRASSTPSPTTEPVVLPAGDGGLPFGACGSLVDAAPSIPPTTDLTPWMELEESVVEAGEPVLVTAVVPLTAEDGAAWNGITPASGPQLAVSRDGVVVAVGDLYGGRDVGFAYQYAWGEDAPRTYVGQLDLVVCDDGEGTATAGRSLPAGTYEIRPWAEVATIADEQTAAVEEMSLEDAVVSPLANHGTAIGDPVAVEVVGTAAWPAPRQPSDAALTPPSTTGAAVCGDPAPVDVGGSPQLRLTVAPGATTVASGSPLSVDATLTYTGPDHVVAWIGWFAEYLVVRDGIVVGTTEEVMDGMLHSVDLGSGAHIDVDREAVLTACTEYGYPGDPLPAGTYTVHPQLAISSVVPPSGGDPVDWHSALGEPFEVTLT